jgi:phosphohistidine phosphatase
VIYHSDLLRAEQTAEILARHLGASARRQSRAGLRPDDAVPPVVDWLLEEGGHGRCIALVGHLPFLDRLASLLLVGQPQAQILDFEPGTLVKLRSNEADGAFAVSWMLAPAVV